MAKKNKRGKEKCEISKETWAKAVAERLQGVPLRKVCEKYGGGTLDNKVKGSHRTNVGGISLLSEKEEILVRSS